MKLTSMNAPPVGDNRGLGVLLDMASGQTITAATSPELLLWDTEIYKDIDALHNTTTNTSRIVTPAGVKRMLLSALIHTDDLGATTHYKLIELLKNGSATFDGASAFNQRDVTNMTPRMPIMTVLEVAEGDYFELQYTTTATETLIVNQTWFAATVIL
jgi:hypothetical protein